MKKNIKIFLYCTYKIILRKLSLLINVSFTMIQRKRLLNFFTIIITLFFFNTKVFYLLYICT